MEDGQTDTTVKSCWWFITINNFSQDELLKLKSQHRIIKSTRGVEEIGGVSKIHHVHCLLNTDHVRASQIKELFPRANIKAKFKGKADDSVKTAIDYIEGTSQKKVDDDTAIEGTRWFTQHRGEQSLSFGDSLKRLAEFAWSVPECNRKFVEMKEHSPRATMKDVYKEEYEHCVSEVCEEDINLLAIYSQTQYKTSWVAWRKIVIKARQTDNQTSITFSPTPGIADGVSQS